MPEHPTQSGSRAEMILADLTAPQHEAVTHGDGPLLVIAGPGSGKTRTITRRIAYLVLEVGVAPWNVLAVTFTNKAAGEMRQRVAELLSEKQAAATACTTFHSYCARLLRIYGERIGLDPRYSIYDTADQKRAVKQAFEQLSMSTQNLSPASVLSAISNAKNELIGPAEYVEYARDFFSRQVAGVYQKYQQILKRNNALDFDDLLLRSVELLRQDAAALSELRDRHQYVLIDEYQDTNRAQFVIANALAAEHGNLCVTGDPDQSIYRWRGADIRNILEFEQNYPKAQVVRLEQNYRSTGHILAAADGLIRHNARRKHKKLWTQNQPGDPVSVVRLQDERAEAHWLAQTFRDLHDRENHSWGAMAVFYRVNSLSRVIEDALRDGGVPYQIARGTAFYDRKEIKDAVAYLRFIANPADEVNLLRIINTPTRGVSSATIKALHAHAVAHQTHVPAVLDQAASVTSLNARAVKSVARFASQLADWRKQTESVNESLRSFVEQVIRESGLWDHHGGDAADPDQDRLMNLGELVSGAQQFEEELSLGDTELIDAPLSHRLESFLERVALVSDLDAVESGEGAVTLMTLHSAKGLEFPVVAMVGVEDGLLPHNNSQADSLEIEEERRLCFVGLTRAMRRLILTHTRFRSMFGRTAPAVPSRFLAELPVDSIEIQDQCDTDLGFSRQRDPDWSLSDETAMYPPGCGVRHPQFGVGRVLRVISTGPQARAQIEFARVGVKTLVLEYAHLERIEFDEDM